MDKYDKYYFSNEVIEFINELDNSGLDPQPFIESYLKYRSKVWGKIENCIIYGKDEK